MLEKVSANASRQTKPLFCVKMQARQTLQARYSEVRLFSVPTILILFVLTEGSSEEEIDRSLRYLARKSYAESTLSESSEVPMPGWH